MGILHSGIVNSFPEACIKAICDKDMFLVRVARAFLPKTIALYKDPIKMLDNEKLDAVFITTPINYHVPLIVDLARRNRDLSLFVEKPLAVSYEQAKIACEAVSDLRGVCMVGYQKRFSPVFQKARDLVRGGLLGELVFFRAYLFSSDAIHEGNSWRFRNETGGVLLDLAPHLLDILRWFFGNPVVVAAAKRHVHSTNVDDYVHVLMSFKSGLKGHLDVCWSIESFRLPEISIEVYGKNGILTVSDDCAKLRLNKKVGSATSQSQVYHRQSFDTSVSFLLAEPEFTREDEAFLAALREGSVKNLNFYDAAKVNEIIDQINLRIIEQGDFSNEELANRR